MPKMRIRLNPLNDYLFLKMFGEKGDEVQLTALLNAVLHRTGKDALQSVEIVGNRYLSAENLGRKGTILDVRALLGDGTKVNIEVQLNNEGDMAKRSLLYWGRQYVKGIKKGGSYDDLPKVIAINIVDYRFDKSENFHTCYRLREDGDHSLILTDALEIHFIDMVKFRKLRAKDKKNPLHRWLLYLNKNTKQDILKEIMDMDTAIQEAQKKMTFVMTDEDALREYEMREFADIEITSGLRHATKVGLERGMRKGRREGRAKGREEGRAEGRAELMKKIVLNLHKLTDIAKSTKLTEADVFRILDEN